MAEITELLKFKGLPAYNEISGSDIFDTLYSQAAYSAEVFDNIFMSDNPITWKESIAPIFDFHEEIVRLFKVASHIYNVKNEGNIHYNYERIAEAYEEYAGEFANHRQIHWLLNEFKDSSDYANATPVQKRLVDYLIYHLERNGALLPPGKRRGIALHGAHLAKLASTYNDNIQHCTDTYAYYAETEEVLAGIPEDVIARYRAAAEKEGKPGYKLTLHAPSYLPVMRFADNRALRQTLYTAYVTRASRIGQSYGHQDFTGGVNENGVYIKQMMIMRKRIAEFRGQQTPAEFALSNRMLNSADQVISFLKDVAEKARPFAEREYEALQAFAQQELEIEKLEAWDIAYVSEKLCQTVFGFSEQDVRVYFPMEKALEGLFNLAKRLFNIDVIQEETPDTVLDPLVRLYRVEEDGKLLGKFCMDAYARVAKQGGAWMDDAVFRRIRTDGTFQYPIGHLVCNFSEPAEDNPTLLTHDEVLTLFHEFGHMMHLILSEVNEYQWSGMNGVEWDAVELPSQFMENFGWEWPVVESISSHVETGEAMPKELFDQMRSAKNFLVGMRTLKQIEYALFDIYLHSQFDPEGKETFEDVLARARKEVAVVTPPEFDRFAQSFSHIFGGGYDAGYYSYKWSDVLSADAYSAFQEAAEGNPDNLISRELGMKFRKEILAVGSTRPMIESYKAFRGRAPMLDAYIQNTFSETPDYLEPYKLPEVTEEAAEEAQAAEADTEANAE